MADAETIVRRAVYAMGQPPTPEQGDVIATLASFAVSRGPRDIVVVDGYAGTGKTTVIGAIITALKISKINTVLLAPTGRAAKVATMMSELEGKTIHRHIYRPDIADPSGRKWTLGRNFQKDTIYFVDEASMVTDEQQGRSVLRDLLHYVYYALGCNIVFVGDTAQLPPVGQSDSPAMNPFRLRSLRLNPIMLRLTQPLRQSLDSGMLFNATIVRRCLESGTTSIPTLRTRGFDDIRMISSAELAEEMASSWSKVGEEETLLITRSNWRANRYNEEVRRRVLYAESPLQSGERLIVSRNNYFWTRDEKEKGRGASFLANGETVILDWVGHPEKMYGRWFVDAEITVPGRENVVGVKIMLRSLRAEGTCIPSDEMDKLYAYAMSQYEGELTEKMAAVDNDPYYNALQVKYAYAVTCHKAQGGQWRHVYIDMSGIDTGNLTPDFYRWLYTALTRATERVYLINPTIPVEE